MAAAITVENLSKCYRINHEGDAHGKYKTLRDSLASLATAPFRRFTNGGSDAKQEEFWALKDVSFSLKAGEVLGIIGRNGAGKSTLLKILSGITKPTTGNVKVRGRVGSLLEVGTGFHPELTGRENIFLNGSILGMNRQSINKRFDEIVSFAEIERFLDTPVKRYSSGMYVRLAFAVAAHLEPEILVIDEVLAVGDAAFQAKCLGKMEDIAVAHGRTILFVSHNMHAVRRLCTRAILMDKGRSVLNATTQKAVQEYLGHGSKTLSFREWPDVENCPGNEIARLRSISIRTDRTDGDSVVDIRNPLRLEMRYDVRVPGYALVPNYHVFNDEGVCLFIVQDLDPEWHHKPKPIGTYVNTIEVPGNFLAEGTIIIGAALSSFFPLRVHFYERDAVICQISDVVQGRSARGDYEGHLPGLVRPLLNSTTTYLGVS